MCWATKNKKQWLALLLVLVMVQSELVSSGKVFKIVKKISKIKKLLPLLLLGPKIVIINKSDTKTTTVASAPPGNSYSSSGGGSYGASMSYGGSSGGYGMGASMNNYASMMDSYPTYSDDCVKSLSAYYSPCKDRRR